MKRKFGWFDLFNTIFLVLLCIIIVGPFILVGLQSVMTKNEIVLKGFTFFPKEFTLSAYKYLFTTDTKLINGFKISIFITVMGTALSLFFTSTYAYVISKKYMPYKNILTLFAFITMLFSGGLVPAYILVVGLNLLNSVWSLILPIMISPWNMFIMRNFFMNIPSELEEAATIDGANDMRIWAQIVIPLSMPAIATIGLFYAVGIWNSWVPASIYITDINKWPLQLILRRMVTEGTLEEQYGDEIFQFIIAQNVKSAAIMITSIPILLVYPFIQKYFVKGVLVGSVKG
jgi:ABC-type glycerol-3-phosphate transport system permease component